MLASPLYPTPSFSPTQNSDDHLKYHPTKDLETFNSLLPPPIEFVEGSSSGALAVAEGKYQPINVTPKALKTEANGAPRAPPTTPKSPKTNQTSRAVTKLTSLYTLPLDTSWIPNISVGAGLYNTGNTCFLNSALQCLLHTPPLLRVILAHGKPVDPCQVKSGSFCMSCAFKQLMFESHAGKKRALSPSSITNKMQVIAKHMRRGRQEDSHEFLRYAIDAFQKSCLAGHPPKLDPKLAETTWVHKIFGGRLRSRVTCHECNHNSDTFDSILDLSVDIHECHGLKETLRKFVAVDYLKGANKYKCEKCKKSVIAEKQFTIHDAPLVLTVHLKRFTPLGRKIGHLVRYEERITLRPAMSEGQFGPWYSLIGVISHAGGGPNSGHYYAHVKAGNGQWFEMNDESVSRHHGVPISLKNAYILFYMREKGQALEAVTSSTSSHSLLSPLQTPVVNGIKKRRVVESDTEEDTGIKATPTSQPFIGPVLPPSLPPTSSPTIATTNPPTSIDTAPRPDPQAQMIKKKIQAASQKASGALQSLAQYSGDEDDEGDDTSKPGAAAGGNDDDKSMDVDVDPAIPQSSPPKPSPSSPVAPSPIPASSFYGTSAARVTANEKKRKSPDGDSDDDDDDDSPTSSQGFAKGAMAFSSPHRGKKRHGPGHRKSSFGGGALNPYTRLSGSNNLQSRRNDTPMRPLQRYGKKRKNFLM